MIHLLEILRDPDIFMWIIAALFACAGISYAFDMQGWKAIYCACASLINVSVIMGK